MKIERLGQILIKPGAQPEFPFSILLARGQRDRFFPGLTLFRFHHQVEPAAVGQPDIADQDFKAQMTEQAQGILHVGRGDDLMTTVIEETREDFAAVLVILD